MKNKIILNSKSGVYTLYQDEQKIDIGDYLEVKFIDISNVETIIICNRQTLKVSYNIEVHFSAIHNKDNVLNTTFVSCSKFVNKHIRENWEKISAEIIPMSIIFKRCIINHQ